MILTLGLTLPSHPPFRVIHNFHKSEYHFLKLKVTTPK
jgi:hypothetical protein